MAVVPWRQSITAGAAATAVKQQQHGWSMPQAGPEDEPRFALTVPIWRLSTHYVQDMHQLTTFKTCTTSLRLQREPTHCVYGMHQLNAPSACNSLCLQYAPTHCVHSVHDAASTEQIRCTCDDTRWRSGSLSNVGDSDDIAPASNVMDNIGRHWATLVTVMTSPLHPMSWTTSGDIGQHW